MSLFPDEDILTKEIESWKGFADRLSDEDRGTFTKMLDDCYKYSKAINTKGLPFPTDLMILKGFSFDGNRLPAIFHLTRISVFQLLAITKYLLFVLYWLKDDRETECVWISLNLGILFLN